MNSTFGASAASYREVMHLLCWWYPYPYLCQPKVTGRAQDEQEWKAMESLRSESTEREDCFYLTSTGWARAEKPAPLLIPSFQTPPVSLSPSDYRWGAHTLGWWYLPQGERVHSSLFMNPFPIRICIPIPDNVHFIWSKCSVWSRYEIFCHVKQVPRRGEKHIVVKELRWESNWLIPVSTGHRTGPAVTLVTSKSQQQHWELVT